MARFKKGSQAAKDFMRKLRAKRKGITLSRRSIPQQRRSRVRTIKSKRTSFTMAKKRKSSRRKGMFGALQRPLVAGITYAFIQPFFSQFLQRFNIGIQDELVQILAAIVLKNVVRNPIVNNWANAAIIINTASLASTFAGKVLPNFLNTSTPAASITPTVQIVG